MDSVALHLHSIADAGRVPSIVDSGASHGEWLTEVPVEKKNKKRFDRCNRMGYKGIIN